MKYAQEYAHIISDSGFPLEWRESAIEYKQLKKLIKNVSKELSGLGLNPDVLNKLLHPPDLAASPTSPSSAAFPDPTSSAPSPSQAFNDSNSSAGGSNSPTGFDAHQLEFEFSSDSSADESEAGLDGSEDAKGKGRARPIKRSWTDDTGKRFRVRVKGEGGGGDESSATASSAGDLEPSRIGRSKEERRRSSHGDRHQHERIAVKGGFMAEYEIGGSTHDPRPRLRLVPLPSNQSIPQSRRLSSSSSPRSSRDNSPSRPLPPPTIDSALSSPPLTDSPTSPPKSSIPLAPPVDAHSSPLNPYANHQSTERSDDESSAAVDDDVPNESDTPDAEPLMASTPRYYFHSAKSPIWALQSGAEEGFEGLHQPLSPNATPTLAATSNPTPPPLAFDEPEQMTDDEEDELVPPGFTPVLGLTPKRALPLVAIQPATPEGLLKSGGAGRAVEEADLLTLDGGSSFDDGDALSVIGEGENAIPQRELYIELASDVEFFDVLTHALTTLDNLQRTQQALFRQTVDHLCRQISKSAMPAAPISSSRSKLGTKLKLFNGGDGHSDLYVWREVFTLWIEAEIFESRSERDRGERTVEEAERRLKAFAGEVTRRGLGDRRTLKSRESRAALNTFLQLNLTLLDLKKFQTANINAARKILKKHDKRTALTASRRFPNFVISSLDAAQGSEANVKTWTLFDSSLPHVLLSCLTTTLLPVIPSLEDYSCAICVDLAWKPIRLDCGHRFCVRCLAKMQRAGKRDCPMCRMPVLATADARNLDLPAMDFMKMYFPREVKYKQRLNEKEVAKEDMEDMGLDGSCVVM